MCSMEFNKEYFDKLMEDAAKEEASKHANSVNVIFERMDKNTLLNFFKLEGKEFYKALLLKLGSLRYKERANKNMQKAIEEVMLATGLGEQEAKEYLMNEEAKEKANLNGMATIKLVCGKILGFLKFSLDVALLSTAFVGRVGCKLITNLGKAVIDTGKYAKEEGKEVGKSIKDSWNYNMKGQC